MEAITNETALVVRSSGLTKYMAKGKEHHNYGPQYIHFKEECLRRYESDLDKDVVYGPGDEFDFTRIQVDDKTLQVLTEDQLCDLRKFGIRI